MPLAAALILITSGLVGCEGGEDEPLTAQDALDYDARTQTETQDLLNERRQRGR